MRSVLVWHPGSPYATGDVSRGLVHGLRAAGVRVTEYQQAGRFAASRLYLETAHRRAKRRGLAPRAISFGDVARHASAGILEAACRVRPEWVIVVNGGYQDPTFYVFLRRCGFRVALVGTESPYQIAAELHIARHVDHIFLNERAVVDTFRLVGASASYLPAAFDPVVHHLADPRQDVPRHDVVYVGTGFPERIAWLERMTWPDGADVALYGDWRLLASRSPLRRFVRGGGRPISNAYASTLYRAARVGINLHRTSANLERSGPHVQRAQSANPRAYELPACGVGVVSDTRAELRELYGDYPGLCDTPAAMSAIVARFLRDRSGAEDAARALRVRMERHSWHERARELLNVLDAPREQH